MKRNLLLLLYLSPLLLTALHEPEEIITGNGWILQFVDSEELHGGNGSAVNAFDSDPATYWHTEWCLVDSPPPHEIQIDLGKLRTISGFLYLPRQDGCSNGGIAEYELYTSTDGYTWDSPNAAGTFEPGCEEKRVTFAPVVCRFIRLRAISEINGNPWTCAAEINLVE